MDENLYKNFRREAESIEKSATLREILLPKFESAGEVLTGCFRSDEQIAEDYFKHVKHRKLEELDYDINLEEDDFNVRTNVRLPL